jgi:predicted 2-oxoglutarate/Fe(II)-dependent dioxygenase YbiX
LVHSVKPITKGTRYSLVLWSPFMREDQPQNNEQPVLSQGQDPIVF